MCSLNHHREDAFAVAAVSLHVECRPALGLLAGRCDSK